VALDVVVASPVVAAVPGLRALVVHFVAKRVRGRPGRPPQQLALVVVGPAVALVAISLAHTAGLAVDLEDIRGTVFALAGTKLGQVALLLGAPALGARDLGLAGAQVAAASGRAARVPVQHAGGAVATGIVAVVDEAAVALLAGLDEAVPADRTVEQSLRLVAQTVIHPVLEGQCQVLQGTGGPVRRPRGAARRRHYAPASSDLSIAFLSQHLYSVTLDYSDPCLSLFIWFYFITQATLLAKISLFKGLWISSTAYSLVYYYS
jgi:hypothetical protein